MRQQDPTPQQQRPVVPPQPEELDLIIQEVPELITPQPEIPPPPLPPPPLPGPEETPIVSH